MHGRPDGKAGYNDQGAPADTYYSLGWFNRVVADGKLNHWHTGSLPGTAAILIRRHDGWTFAALFNARSSAKAKHFGQAIDRQLHQAANAVTLPNP